MPIKWAVLVGMYYIYKKNDTVYVVDRANRPNSMGNVFHENAGLLAILLTNTDSVDGAIALMNTYMPAKKQQVVSAIALD